MVITTLSIDPPTNKDHRRRDLIGIAPVLGTTARSTAGLPSERRSTALCLSRSRVHDRELHRTAAMVMRCAIHPLDAGVDQHRLRISLVWVASTPCRYPFIGGSAH